MRNRINFICKACMESRPGGEPPVLAIAIRNSGRPDEIPEPDGMTEPGWNLLQVCPNQLGEKDAARRSLPESRRLNAIVRSLPGGASARAIVEVHQDYDQIVRASYSDTEWHEHNYVRNLAYEGRSKSSDLDGEEILMHYPRVATRPIHSEGRAKLQCSYGHKVEKTRAELVKAARKAFHDSESSVPIGFVKV